MEQPQQLEKPGCIYWKKAGLVLLYLREGLLEFVADITEAEHKRILSKLNLTKDSACICCDLKSLQPNHKSKVEKHNGSMKQTCPVGNNNCNCIKSAVIPCQTNVCGVIYDEIIKCYTYTQPSPSWKNTDVHKWCSSSFEVAKCFINAPGYLKQAKLSEIDCAGLIHMVICNRRIRSHIDCRIDGNDVFCKMLRNRNKIFRSHSMELSEQELISIIEDAISILEDTKELKQSEDAKASVKKILELKNSNLKITADEEVNVCKAAMTAIGMLPEKLKDMSETMESLKQRIKQLELPNLHDRMDHLETRIEVIEIDRRAQSSHDKKQTLDLNQQRFLRLYLWNTEGGTFVLNGILQREVQNTGTSLSDMVMQNKEKLKSEYHNVFLLCGKQLDMNQWDTLLYSQVLQSLFRASLSWKERSYILRIQNMQSVIEEHAATASIDEFTYEDITAELTNTLPELVEGLDESTRSQFWEIENRYKRYTGDGADLFHRLKKKPFITANANDLISLLENQMTEKGEASTFGSSTEENTDCTSEHSEISVSRHSSSTGSTVKHGDNRYQFDHGIAEENRLRENVTAFASDPENELNVSDRMEIHRSTEATPEELTEWQRAEVNIAVVGRTGSGKSTLVNALRGIEKGDAGYAPTGVIEETEATEVYVHPNNQNVKIWDLPGYDSPLVPFDKYLDDKKINVKPYDVFIITTSTRIYANDINLAKELEKRNLFYLFVRTKCDQDIDELTNEADVMQILQIIRKNCADNLKKSLIKENDIYIISGKLRDHPMLDFIKLSIRILDNLPDLKSDALLFSIPVKTEMLLEKKIAVLKKRMLTVAGKSCGGAIVPVPGFSLALDLKLITREIELYREQLGLTKENLEKVLKIKDIKANEFSEVQFKSFTLASSAKQFAISFVQLLPVLQLVAASEIVEKAFVIIPVVGSLVGGVVSFASTYYTLKFFLDALSEDARIIIRMLK